MKKILFLIHDLGQGGAEKVLVNLVNNMDRSKFDISVTVLFGGGVNEQFLAPYIHYHAVFPKEVPGNSKLMKLLTPTQLHKLCVKEHYDIEVAYLEGPSARVISGCEDKNTRLVSWIHSTIKSIEEASTSFRNKKETYECYRKFNRIVCVSQGIYDNFCCSLKIEDNVIVLYNTFESDIIMRKSTEEVENSFDNDSIKMIAVGSLKEVKGYDRLLRIAKRLKENGYVFKLYFLGIGPLQQSMEKYIHENDLEQYVFLFGYQTNPYKYVSCSDLFLCSSFSEGFSTAATEALIVGTPVCTVEVSGMKEMLGENNEYGVVVENNEEALYQGIKRFLDDPDLLKHYKKQAEIRGKDFSTEKTVQATEQMLMELGV